VNVFRDDIRVALAPNADTGRESLAAQHFRDGDDDGQMGTMETMGKPWENGDFPWGKWGKW
jgi:hypothetical protein